MAVNLTKVRARINNIKKKIYYDKSIQTLKLYNVNDLVLELSKDWFMNTDLPLISPLVLNISKFI